MRAFSRPATQMIRQPTHSVPLRIRKITTVARKTWVVPTNSTLSERHRFKPRGTTSSLLNSSFHASAARFLFIQTETTPNPETLKFLPGLEVLSPSFGTGMFFQKGEKREWQQSPLASRLFALEGVKNVFLGADFVTVGKDSEEAWGGLKPQIFSLLMDAFAEEGFKVMSEAGSDSFVTDTTILEDDDEIVAMIKELLETRVRPAVQEDGGDIFYVSFDEGTGVVRVRLAGSCQGCPSSSVTLKSGVENMLMHYIPEVTSVEAVDEDVAQLEREQADFARELEKPANSQSSVGSVGSTMMTEHALPLSKQPGYNLADFGASSDDDDEEEDDTFPKKELPTVK